VATSKQDKQRIMEMANLTAYTSFSFGSKTIATRLPRGLLCVILRVRARLIQSFKVPPHVLLKSAPDKVASSPHQEALHQLLSLTLIHKSLRTQ
jgi:hypothetical protein